VRMCPLLKLVCRNDLALGEVIGLLGPVMVRWLGIFFGHSLRGSDAPRVGAGESRAATSNSPCGKRVIHGAADGDGRGSSGIVFARLWKNWRRSLQVVRPETVCGGTAGASALLGMKSRLRWGRPRLGGPAGSDTADEAARIAVGAPRIQRASCETRPDCLAGDGVEVHGPASEAAVAGVANILEEPRPDLIGWISSSTTATFRVLFVLVVLTHSGVGWCILMSEHPTANGRARNCSRRARWRRGPGI